jgi:hypothetical protein
LVVVLLVGVNVVAYGMVAHGVVAGADEWRSSPRHLIRSI